MHVLSNDLIAGASAAQFISAAMTRSSTPGNLASAGFSTDQVRRNAAGDAAASRMSASSVGKEQLATGKNCSATDALSETSGGETASLGTKRRLDADTTSAATGTKKYREGEGEVEGVEGGGVGNGLGGDGGRGGHTQSGGTGLGGDQLAGKGVGGNSSGDGKEAGNGDGKQSDNSSGGGVEGGKGVGDNSSGDGKEAGNGGGNQGSTASGEGGGDGNGAGGCISDKYLRGAMDLAMTNHRSEVKKLVQSYAKIVVMEQVNQEYAKQEKSYQDALAKKDEALVAMQGQLDAAVKAKDAAVEAKDAVVKEKNAAVEAKDDAVKAKDAAVKAKDAAIADMQQANDENDILRDTVNRMFANKRPRQTDDKQTDDSADAVAVNPDGGDAAREGLEGSAGGGGNGLGNDDGTDNNAAGDGSKQV